MAASDLLIVRALAPLLLCAAASGLPVEVRSADAPVVAKAVFHQQDADAGSNLLQSDAWRPWQAGFSLEADAFVCDNGADIEVQRGISQTVVLNQDRPEPIVATAWSKSLGVSGAADRGYALYLDLIYADGTPLWGQTASFRPGTHDWERRQVLILPEKPIKQVSYHLLLRGHGGKAFFRDPRLVVLETPHGVCRFDGVSVRPTGPAAEGFQVRDVEANSDFVRISQHALGLKLDCRPTQQEDVTVFDVELADTTGHDRAVTLVYAWPIAADSLRWLHDACDVRAVQAGREYLNASNFRVAGGRLSRYPFAAVADAQSGWAVGMDMARPAFFRLGYNVTTEELFLAYDLGLTPEKPTARLRLCRYRFDPQWEFRAALARYYKIFPEAFRCRTPVQGLWMPFAPISRVEGFGDFGFKFKEGTNETDWDDEHDIFTFRYTEPMTWWMPLPERSERTLDAALAEAQKLAAQGNAQARALLTSGYRNEDGQIPAQLLDTPWCNGAVWSVNSMPGIVGEVTDFRNKWNPTLRQRLYGPQRSADLDGEYIDSSEGYVTDELDYCRDHFATCDTPLTFAPETHRPAVFRGLIAFEYIRAIAADVHAMDRLMMANSTPIRLCWLAPLLDVMGTETDWNPGGNWLPMSDRELLYRRALCKSKPFCFLMNTQFERFSSERVERYMKRSLAFGMFPGFFSHNASQGHYFTRPELYHRDRPLFKKYIPLCRQVAEAGWEPITRARCSDPQLHLERFGQRFLTVLNVASDPCTATIRLEGDAPATSRDLVSGREIFWQHQQTELTLAPEDVALIDLGE